MKEIYAQSYLGQFVAVVVHAAGAANRRHDGKTTRCHNKVTDIDEMKTSQLYQSIEYHCEIRMYSRLSASFHQVAIG
jgi:hypothetical protein